MALTNTQTGEYLKIISFQFDFKAGNHHITYYIFKDADQRNRYESGLSEYELFKQSQYNGIGIINNQLSAITDKTTAKDAIFKACYDSLKADMFNSWVDA